LSNVLNKDITIVFTNEGTSSVNLSPIFVDSSLHNEISIQNENYNYVDTFNHIPNAVREFNERNFKFKKSEPNQNINYNLLSAKTWAIGEEHVWDIVNKNDAHEKRTATLRKQETVSERTVNIWVENSEYVSGKIDNTTINSISQYLNTIVNSVVSVAGEPWGEHKYPDLIPADQPLNIVFVNYDKDNKAFGTLGYFYSINNLLNEGDVHDSNEALAIFVDTETIYLNSDGKLHIVSTIAHELTHAVHFYQRAVHIDDSFDTFLNEMSAIMMEDIVAKKIDPIFNDSKLRYTKWHNGTSYHYDFAHWKLGGDINYNIAGSFGAYLLRQHGVDFYKTLFATRSDSSVSGSHAKSLNILDKAIKSYNGNGLGRALQRWGASIAMFPANASPEGFGYPDRINDNGFTFEAFDGSDYKQHRALPTSSPASLSAHGHFPFLRKALSDTYTESFVVPSNVSVTIVVK
jgi:hypothetical protein